LLIRRSAGDASVQAHHIADRLVAQCHDFGCIDPRNFQQAVADGEVPEGIAEAFGAAGEALHRAKRALDPKQSAQGSGKSTCTSPPSDDLYTRQRRVRARYENHSSIPADLPPGHLTIIADFWELLLSPFAADALVDVSAMQVGAMTMLDAAIAEAERTDTSPDPPGCMDNDDLTMRPPGLPHPALTGATGLDKPVPNDSDFDVI
jgi:hypothetical protein